MAQTELSAIDFTATGNGAALTREGWAVPETHGTWAIGGRSRLVLPIAAGARNRVVSFVASCFTATDKLPGQRIAFTVSGRKIHSTEVGGWTSDTFSIPEDLLVSADGTLDVVLVQPDATAPAAIGLSGDVRELGFFFQRLTVIGETAEEGVVVGQFADPSIGASQAYGAPAEQPDVALSAQDLADPIPGTLAEAPPAKKPPSPAKRRGWLSVIGW